MSEMFLKPRVFNISLYNIFYRIRHMKNIYFQMAIPFTPNHVSFFSSNRKEDIMFYGDTKQAAVKESCLAENVQLHSL